MPKTVVSSDALACAVDEVQYGLGHGVRSSLSLPMSAGEQVGGAMNLCAVTANAFADPAVVAHAAAFAAQGGAVLTVSRRLAEQAQSTEQLGEARILAQRDRPSRRDRHASIEDCA